MRWKRLGLDQEVVIAYLEGIVETLGAGLLLQLVFGCIRDPATVRRPSELLHALGGARDAAGVASAQWHDKDLRVGRLAARERYVRQEGKPVAYGRKPGMAHRAAVLSQHA